MPDFDIVVMGAGLGGLSAAACLAKQGYRVAVLEQHYLPGGCCHTFDYGNYSFCADVHYVYQCGADETIGRFLRFIDRDVPFNSLDPDCIDRVVAPDIDFRIPLGWETLRNRLLAEFPSEAAAIHRYCDVLAHLHAQARQFQQEVRWYDHHWRDWLKLPKYWDLFTHSSWTLQDLYDRTGLSPTLQLILAGQSGDYALPPAGIALLSHTAVAMSYAEGAYYPRHHFRHFVESVVEAIRSHGGSVLTSTPVTHIEVADRQVHSVVAGGDTYRAERYISDLDPKLTVELMGSPDALSPGERRRLTGYAYSASAYNVYLGLAPSFQPERYGIGNWNVWYYPDPDLNRAYRLQLEGDLDRPWLFISCPTMKSNEPGMAPPGHHVLEVATVCRYEPFSELHRSDPAAYRARKRQVFQSVMRTLRDLIPDVDAHVRMKVYGTPTTSEFFLGQPRGNIYGADLTPDQVGLHRLGYRTEVENLLLVGASAGYPSVAGVIANGMDVTRLITGEPVSPPTTRVPVG